MPISFIEAHSEQPLHFLGKEGGRGYKEGGTKTVTPVASFHMQGNTESGKRVLLSGTGFCIALFICLLTSLTDCGVLEAEMLPAPGTGPGTQ